MMRAMYSAISGLRAHQMMLDVAANDLANVNTLGYKSGRVTFKDSLAQTMRGATATSPASGGSNAAQIGLGVNLGSIDNQMSGGSLQSTGNPLDVAITGEGFFRVAPSIGGRIEYTRAGNFTLNSAGDLITQDGNYVLGRSYNAGPPATAGSTDQKLTIPSDATAVNIGQDGVVSYTDAAGVRAYVGFISTATFTNASGLERTGDSRWTASPASGAEGVTTPGLNGAGATVSGTVEMSNVDMANEFTTMITAQRGFQASSRVISTADEMLQELVNLKH